MRRIDSAINLLSFSKNNRNYGYNFHQAIIMLNLITILLNINREPRASFYMYRVQECRVCKTDWGGIIILVRKKKATKIIKGKKRER
jgi:hypothetical protein